MSTEIQKNLRRAFVTSALGVLAFSVSSNPSHAAECPIRVDSDNQTVELTEDLYVSGDPATCITVVEADNIVIRLNGFSIIGNGGNIDDFGPPGGINLVDANNVVVEGPGTITNFARGIAVIGSKNVGINGVELIDNSRGIHLGRRGLGFNTAPNDVTITNTKINKSRNRDGSTDGGQGIVVFSYNNPEDPDEVTENIHIANVKIKNSERQGIAFGRSSQGAQEVGGRFLIENCSVKNNLVGISIAAGSDITVRDCEISDHDAEAIVVSGTPPGFATISRVKIRDSVLKNNGFGLHLGQNNIQDDVKLRSTCFENSLTHILNETTNPEVDIIQLDNEFDPVGGC